MLIENPEALKGWLVVILEPLCDADSSALARYVLALLKKEKPEKELKKVMIEQLDVFLAEETTPFVDKLFDAINSKEYLIPVPPSLSGSIKIEDSEVEALGSDDVGNTDSGIVKSENSVESAVSNDKKIDSSSSVLNAVSPISIKSERPNQVTMASEAKTKEHHHQSYQKSSEPSQSASTSADNRGTYQASPHSPPAHRSETASQSHTHQSSHHHAHQNASTSSNTHVRSASPPARTNADKENQPRDSRRRRASLRSRSRSPRSRSRSNERFSYNTSRDRRANDREKNHRQFRNKSPPSSSIEGRHTNERRRIGGDIRRRLGVGGGSSGRTGNNNDDRSPRFSGVSGSNAEAMERKLPRSSNNARSHSRSRSPSAERNNGRSGKNSPNSNTSRQQARRPSAERHRASQNVDFVPTEKRQRCIDFEEKGYCMRGETCPWDHGNNPVVFEGVNNTSLLNMSLREYNPDVPELWATGRSGPPTANMLGNTVNVVPSSINPFTGAARPNAAASPATAAIMGPTANNVAVEYIRGTTVISASNVSFRGAAPMLPYGFNPPGGMQSHLQRELIPVPVLDAGGVGSQVDVNINGSKRRYDGDDVSNVSADGPPKRKPPINSRLGPRVNSMQNNCSLELRKVPRGLNTITHLNNHFAKFGKIVNIQISYDGDPEAAIITFSTHAEANVAYRSTEAVLNNRFIKVFWHNQDNIVSSSMAPAAASSDAINRKSSHYHLNKTQVVVSTTSASTADAASLKANNTPATQGEAASTNSESAATPNDNENSNTTLATMQPSMRLKNNVTPRPANAAIIRKKQEEQAKAVVHLANGLRKRKQELLQSYLKQMKSAVELVERCEPNDPQRSKTLETIKILQETIDKLRKEIATEQEQAQAQIQSQHQPPVVAVAPTIKKTKEQQKKELLDIELELFAQQQEGNDTTAIQKRLEELQRSLGIVPGSGTIVGGGGKPHFNSGGRSVARIRPTLPEGSTRVDRRPKAIVVTGFASDEADSVLGHFKNFGEITKHDMDRDIPQLILSYATRINAEQAVVRGKVFKDKRLQITWAPVICQTTKSNAAAGNKPIQADKNLIGGDSAKAGALTDADSDANNLKSPVAKDTLPELRLEDEEEDDENEDRSWRR